MFIKGATAPFFIMNKETILLERMCAWFVYYVFEQNEDKLDNLSSLFVEWQMLNKIDSILDTDAKYYYERLDVNVFAHDVANKNTMRKPGDVAKSMQSLVKELIKHKLKNETSKN